MKKLSVFVAAMATVASMGAAVAAEDGELGATSMGDFEIYYSKEAKIQVWGFKDVYFTHAEGVTKHDKTISLCAMSTSGHVRFKVNSRFYMSDTDEKGAYSITIGNKDNASIADTWGTKGLAANVNGVRSYVALKTLEDGATETCDAKYQVADLTVDLNDSDLAEGTYTRTVTVTAFPI